MQVRNRVPFTPGKSLKPSQVGAADYREQFKCFAHLSRLTSEGNESRRRAPRTEELGVDWSHFGMDRQPFRPAVDPDSYYASPSHETALAAVVAGFARRDPIVLIDGKPGVGKTLVSRKWLEHLLPDVPRVVLPSARAEKPCDLLQGILFDLVKPYVGLTEQELRLTVTGHLLTAAEDSGYPTVLVLDEAQHLSQAALEELRLLGNLETRRGAAIFTLLVAHPSLRESLRLPSSGQFAQRLGSSATVELLTPGESAGYLRHQVRASGGEPSKVFDHEAVTLIAEACGGIPRLLNRAAILAMELTAGAGADRVDVEAALESLDRLGLEADATPDDDADEPTELGEAAEPVLLPHPARMNSGVDAREDEASGLRGSKDNSSRTRTA